MHPQSRRHRILSKPKIRYRVQLSTVNCPCPEPDQSNSRPPTLFIIHSNIIFPSAATCFTCYLPFRLPYRKLYVFLFSTTRVTFPTPPNLTFFPLPLFQFVRNVSHAALHQAVPSAFLLLFSVLRFRRLSMAVRSRPCGAKVARIGKNCRGSTAAVQNQY